MEVLQPLIQMMLGEGLVYFKSNSRLHIQKHMTLNENTHSSDAIKFMEFGNEEMQDYLDMKPYRMRGAQKRPYNVLVIFLEPVRVHCTSDITLPKCYDISVVKRAP